MKIRFYKTIPFTLCLLLLISPLVSSNGIIKKIGISSLILSLLINATYSFIFLLKNQKIDKDLSKIILIITLIILNYIYSHLLIDVPFFSITRLSQLAVIFLFIFFFFNHNKTQEIPGFFYNISILILFIISIHWITHPQISGYKFIFENPNSFGAFCSTLILSLFFKESGRKKPIVIIILLFFIYASSSRTALFCVFIFFIIYNFNLFFYKKIFKILIFTFSITLPFIVIYAMVQIDLQRYDDFFFQYTGKRLTSGRNYLWPMIFEKIKEKPFFGWGSGTNIHELTGLDLSTHNGYLQILLESGIFGLFLHSILIILIGYIFIKSKNKDHFTIFGFSIYTYLLIFQTFEVSMFQNNLTMSLPIWAMIGWCIGHTKSKN